MIKSSLERVNYGTSIITIIDLKRSIISSTQKRIAFVSLHQCFRIPQRDILIFIVINLCLTDRLNYTPDAIRT